METSFTCPGSVEVGETGATMSKQRVAGSSDEAAWDTYWRGAKTATAYNDGGVVHPATGAFWRQALQTIQKVTPSPSVIDIASGSGAVTEQIISVFGDASPDITCLDTSEAALAVLNERFPGVRTLPADASSIPLPSEQFDLVVSQFGIEYAGTDAITEAARLVAAGGRLMLMMHCRPGIIFDECSANKVAIDSAIESRFLPRAISLFETGFAAVRGGDRDAYEAAAGELAPAIQVLEETMSRLGNGVAGGMLAMMYEEVAKIHENIPHYDPDEVLPWARQLETEIAAYSERMSSMCRAAVNDLDLQKSLEHVIAEGLVPRRAGPLLDDDRRLAWILTADRV